MSHYSRNLVTVILILYQMKSASGLTISPSKTASCGPSTIRLCPPLVVTKNEGADVAMHVVEECIQEVGK